MNRLKNEVCLYPGSFDPFTAGHEEIVRKSLDLFERVVIGIGVNSQKKELFTLDQRISIIERVFQGEARVEVRGFQGLTVDFCIAENIPYIVRGLRSSLDFMTERDLALSNFEISGIETVFFNSSSKNAHVSSTLVRDILKNDAAKSGIFAPSNIDYTEFTAGILSE